MTTFLLIVVLALAVTSAVFYLLNQHTKKKLAAGQKQWADDAAKAKAEYQAVYDYYSHQAVKLQAAYDQRIAEVDVQAEHIRTHYEAEARKAQEESQTQLTTTLTQLESLRGYANLQDAEAEIGQKLTTAMAETEALRNEAEALLEQSKKVSAKEQLEAQQQVKSIYAEAEALLTQAARDASKIQEEAERQARELNEEVYASVHERKLLEQAVKAMQNVVDGYGDKYVIPTHSILDELAENFGHTSAGESLRIARERSRNLVMQEQAASCDYVEANRRDTAVRFVIDAFNGRVDAILSRVRTDNEGTLEQEIKDAFALVNLNGEAFRNARILPAYLESRLDELRWAVVAQELKRKEREEQRRIQEQIREEEKSRREYERAIQEAAREEETIRKAMEKARVEAEHASAQERAELEAEMAALGLKLAEAEAKNRRALSMAQQTRSGNVYVVSNVGSFGEHVYKIGMTRRLEPLDRVKELGDASVPFEFDIHAMIRSDDAPSLERQLHEHFDGARINKVNYRKEFFRIPLEQIRSFAEAKQLEVTFTMAAEAREYRETLALERMTPEERAKYNHPPSDEGESE